jgi:DNA (cytosine-5)-methyltransferase 1
MTTTSPPIFTAADLFCGAGGTSAGLLEACTIIDRRINLTAVNHWQRAITTHELNHPEARHRVACLDSLNPRSLFRHRELNFLLASPECIEHSPAKAGKPINEQSRATAWCVTRWADALLPDVILVENVPRFCKWGPLDEHNQPIKERKGEVFNAWKGTLEAMGYAVEYRELCSADYGDPTTRTRLFVQAVRRSSGLKVVWPQATHSESGTTPGTLPWRTVRDCIDWSVKGTSVFDRPKPLRDKTLQRCLAGLRQQGCQPFILPQSSSSDAQSIDRPGKTLTTTSRGIGIVNPTILCMEHGGKIKPIDSPAPTVTTARGGAFALIEPVIITLRGTADRQIKSSAESTDKPAGTVTSGGIHHGLAEFTVHTAYGSGIDRRVKPLDSPAGTICGNRGDLALVSAFLLGQQSGSAPRTIGKPAPTIATGGAISLIEPVVANIDSYHVRIDAVVRIGKDIHCLTFQNGIHHLLCIFDGRPVLVGILFRMLDVPELAAIQGFPPHYRFTGTKTDQVKQIGNAVTRRLARALALAVMTQNHDIYPLLYGTRTNEQAA